MGEESGVRNLKAMRPRKNVIHLPVHSDTENIARKIPFEGASK